MELFKKDSEKLFEIKLELKEVEFEIKLLEKDLKTLDKASSDLVEFCLDPTINPKSSASKKQTLIDCINNANNKIYKDIHGGLESTIDGKEHHTKGVKRKITETEKLNEQLLNKTKNKKIKLDCESIKEQLDCYKNTLKTQQGEQKKINSKTKNIVSPQKTSSPKKEESMGRDYE